MHKGTLMGTRHQVYVLLKIIKYCTNSSAKSHQCKFAVNMVFKNKEPASDKLGEALREVINYRNIRGMFNSVHADLSNLGVTKVEIGDKGLHFEGNNIKVFSYYNNSNM